MENWLQAVNFFFEDGEVTYKEDELDVNVKTYHIEKYPFEKEYHLQITYCGNTATTAFKIDDVKEIKQEVDKIIKEIKKSKYKAKVSINNSYYQAVK